MPQITVAVFLLLSGGTILSAEASAPEDGYCPTLLEIVIRTNFYSQDDERGTVRDILFKDITVLSRVQPPSSFRGFDDEHTLEGVTIQNLRLGDRPIQDASEAPPGGRPARA